MTAQSIIPVLEERLALGHPARCGRLRIVVAFLRACGVLFDEAGFSCELGNSTDVVFLKLGGGRSPRIEIEGSGVMLHALVVNEWNDGSFRRLFEQRFVATEEEYLVVTEEILANFTLEEKGKGERLLPPSLDI